MSFKEESECLTLKVKRDLSEGWTSKPNSFGALSIFPLLKERVLNYQILS